MLYLYESWFIWLWILIGLTFLWTIANIIPIMFSKDPSAGAVLGFLPFIIPLFMLELSMFVIPIMLAYKLIYYLITR